MPRELFRTPIERATSLKAKDRKTNTGRKPFAAVLMFKIVVLQSPNNLSDEQVALLLQERLSFKRFLDLNCRERYSANAIFVQREIDRLAGQSALSCSCCCRARIRKLEIVCL